MAPAVIQRCWRAPSSLPARRSRSTRRKMCHGILGLVHLARYDHDLAEHHYQKALSLNANSATLLASMGSLYTYLGRPEEALDLFREARIIDPFYNPSWYWSAVGAAHLMT